jgi:hypothetical protein
LQDLYAALHAPGEILVLENYESCHAGFLKVLSDLAVRGEAPLSSRYLVKDGILVDAGTALVPGAVGSLTPCGKYLIFFSHRGRDALADRFGAAMVGAVGDVCETGAFTPESLSALAAQTLNALAQKVSARLSMTLSAGADVRDWVAAQNTKARGAAALSGACDKMFRALSEYCLGCEGPAAKGRRPHDPERRALVFRRRRRGKAAVRSAAGRVHGRRRGRAEGDGRDRGACAPQTVCAGSRG